jgi:hypothetical protein
MHYGIKYRVIEVFFELNYYKTILKCHCCHSKSGYVALAKTNSLDTVLYNYNKLNAVLSGYITTFF